MGKSDMAVIISRLLDERRKILRLIQGSNERLDLWEEQGMALSELSNYDNHPGDLGTETFEREKDLSLLINARHILYKIEKALSAIQEGKYGICDKCGNDIDPERLGALPYASSCKDCQETMEMTVPYRPVEEEVVLGFGSFDDSSPGIDGEDVWDLVSSYGNSNTPSDLIADEGQAVNPNDDDYADRMEIVEETDKIPDRRTSR
ncbi:MAG: TraR/DksA C4-type zinc finger protein [Bacillota bacterium]